MQQPIKPRRSVLYLPGSNARALEKARTLPADVLILDLEDAVASDAKEKARQQIVEAVQAGGYGHREVVIRVNALDSQWGQMDVQAVATCGADAIAFPKVESAMQVRQAVAALDKAGAPGTLPVWIMAETPRGILDIDAIAASHSRLKAIVIGTSDLAKALRVPHTPERLGLLTSLGMCVLAARVHGLDILDGVYLDLEDEVGLRAACCQGRELGFDGKTLIHPKQIAIANEIFAPSQEEVERAERMIEAWEQARARGEGVIVCDGKLVESLHVEEAYRVLALARIVKKKGN
ncbi:MAG: CoA ester lyase [Candidatus Competibacteraceae bacterium]|nr:CoA ester lyase [Candidatus Competibacteraceae bacterium]